MSEYIISIKNLAILMAKCHGTKLVEEDGTPICDPSEIAKGMDEPIALKELVRCMDCVWFANEATHGAWCKNFGVSLHDDYDGFCAWGARKNG